MASSCCLFFIPYRQPLAQKRRGKGTQLRFSLPGPRRLRQQDGTIRHLASRTYRRWLNDHAVPEMQIPLGSRFDIDIMSRPMNMMPMPPLVIDPRTGTPQSAVRGPIRIDSDSFWPSSTRTGPLANLLRHSLENNSWASQLHSASLPLFPAIDIHPETSGPPFEQAILEDLFLPVRPRRVTSVPL